MIIVKSLPIQAVYFCHVCNDRKPYKQKHNFCDEGHFLCKEYVHSEKDNLFLCTDEIRSEDNILRSEGISVKILDEISPFAVDLELVKHNDILLDGDYKIEKICHDYPGNDSYCYYCCRSAACDSIDTKALIKCKGCKTWH